MTQQGRRKSNSARELYYDQARLQTLSLILASRFDEMFAALGVGLHHTSRMYYGYCPIHGSDNPNSFNMYHGGDIPGKWVCRTKHCNDIFKKTVLGFIRGILSKDKYDWTHPSDEMNPGRGKMASFEEAVDWACEFIGQKLEDIKVDYDDLEKRQFTTNISLLSRRSPLLGPTITRADVISRLQIPAPYFIERGWSADVLKKYDVGFCSQPNKPMSDRVVVPIYNDDYTHCVGFTGRSIHAKCQACGLYHRPERPCPADHERQLFSKWTNSKGFSRESCLYNYWFAKQNIHRDGVAVLVEGPGDLWRLVEAGIYHGVAMFGNQLSDQQQIILEISGAMTVIVITNMDEAGRYGAKKIQKDLSRSYRVLLPELPTNDLGEMRPAAVKELLLPLVERARR